MPSTVNPNIPAAKSDLESAPIRQNFAAAKADIENLLSKFSGSSAPSNPTTFQNWLDTSVSPNVLRIYDGAVWIATAQLDPVGHTWTALGTQAPTREFLVPGDGVAPGTFLVGASVINLQNTYGTINNIEVHFDGTYQGIDQFASLAGKVLTTTSPLPAGVSKIFIDGGIAQSVSTPPASSVGVAQLAADALAFFLKKTDLTLQASTSYANDAAAATGGVPIGGLYRNGSTVNIRIA